MAVATANISNIASKKTGVSSRLSRIFAVRRYLCTVVITSTGSVTLRMTRRIKNSISTFMRAVGAQTRRLNYAGAIFAGPANLPSRGRRVATRSVTLVVRTTVTGSAFHAVTTAASCALPTAGISNNRHMLAGGFAVVGDTDSDCCRPYVNNGRKCARTSKDALMYRTSGGGVGLMYVMLGKTSNIASSRTVTLLGCNFSGFTPLAVTSGSFGHLSNNAIVTPGNTARSGLAARSASSSKRVAHRCCFKKAPMKATVLRSTRRRAGSTTMANRGGVRTTRTCSTSRAATPCCVVKTVKTTFLLFFLFLVVGIVGS